MPRDHQWPWEPASAGLRTWRELRQPRTRNQTQSEKSGRAPGPPAWALILPKLPHPGRWRRRWDSGFPGSPTLPAGPPRDSGLRAAPRSGPRLASLRPGPASLPGPGLYPQPQPPSPARASLPNPRLSPHSSLSPPPSLSACLASPQPRPVSLAPDSLHQPRPLSPSRPLSTAPASPQPQHLSSAGLSPTPQPLPHPASLPGPDSLPILASLPRPIFSPQLWPLSLAPASLPCSGLSSPALASLLSLDLSPQPQPFSPAQHLSPAPASLPAQPLSLALLWTPASGTHKGLRAQLPSRDSLGQGRHPRETGLHSGVGGAPGAHPQLPWSGPDTPGPSAVKDPGGRWRRTGMTSHGGRHPVRWPRPDSVHPLPAHPEEWEAHPLKVQFVTLVRAATGRKLPILGLFI